VGGGVEGFSSGIILPKNNTEKKKKIEFFLVAWRKSKEWFTDPLWYDLYFFRADEDMGVDFVTEKRVQGFLDDWGAKGSCIGQVFFVDKESSH